MKLQLEKPNLERYIAQQIQAGNFPTAEAVVEDALLRAMEEKVELSAEDLAAIALSEEQFARGEGIDAGEVAARLRAMYGSPANGSERK